MDRLQAMKVFARIVEANSFTAAADSLKMPRTTVTTAIQNLESYLGVRLLNRTTRKLSLTPDGETFYERCLRILAEVDDAEACFSGDGAGLRGRLRIDMPCNIGRNILIPRIGEFRERYPEIELALGIGDRRVDLVGEGVDCVVRIGDLDDSSLIARRVGTFRRLICASPDYFSRYGEPRDLTDLSHHKAVHYISWRTGRPYPWEFLVGGECREVKMEGDVSVNDCDAYVACGHQGFGLIMPPRFMVYGSLQSGALVEVLKGESLCAVPIHVAYPQTRNVSPKVRCFTRWVADVLSRDGRIGEERLYRAA